MPGLLSNVPLVCQLAVLSMSKRIQGMLKLIVLFSILLASFISAPIYAEGDGYIDDMARTHLVDRPRHVFWNVSDLNCNNAVKVCATGISDMQGNSVSVGETLTFTDSFGEVHSGPIVLVATDLSFIDSVGILVTVVIMSPE